MSAYLQIATGFTRDPQGYGLLLESLFKGLAQDISFTRIVFQCPYLAAGDGLVQSEV